MNNLIEKLETLANHEYMCDEQIEVIKEHLKSEVVYLSDRINEGGEQMKQGMVNESDSTDKATQQEEFDKAVNKREKLRKRLYLVSNTLKRLNTEDYGYCLDCGIEISLKRIAAYPTSVRCIDCQTVAEKKKNGFG